MLDDNSKTNFRACNTALATLKLAPVAIATLISVTNVAPSFAGACPSDKVLTTPRDIGDHKNNLVTKKTLTDVPLNGWRGFNDLHLRVRYFNIPVGGVVPTHEHNDRPSIVYILKGEIYEYSALCSVPILHKAGESTPEFGPGHAHWWENKGTEEVILTSSDIVETGQLDKPMPDM